MRFVVESLAEGAKDSDDGVAKLIACIAMCCMRCIENCIEYLNKIAYAYQAISGEPFCKSAWNGFLLNLKYCAKFYFAITISGWFIVIGILFVVFSNMMIGLFLVNYVTKEADDPDVELYGPAFVFFMNSLIVSIVCLGLFDDAVIAILQCYATDTDLHGGYPRFGPKSYHEKLRKVYSQEDDKVEGNEMMVVGSAMV